MHDQNQNGTGFAILQLRIETLEKAHEKEIGELKKELRDLQRDTNKEFDELHDKVDEVATSQGRVEIMFAHLTTTQNEMKESIKEIAASAGKDQGWRALLVDIIKAILLIGGFFLTGKWLG